MRIKIGHRKYIEFRKPWKIYTWYPSPEICKCESPENDLWKISGENIMGLICTKCKGIIQIPVGHYTL